MATDMSDRFALPYLSSGQAQKETTHNEALAIVDMLLHARAESASLAAPPGSAAAGQCWIVAAGGSDAWDGYDDHLACLTSGGWRFVMPRAAAVADPSGGTTIDSEARATLTQLLAVLRDHGLMDAP